MHITYEQWIKGTKLGLTKPRSAQLKAIDETLRQYDRLRTNNQLEYLSYAFSIWKGIKGLNWEKSSRNKNGMVTALDKMLRLPKSELTPMEFVLNEQRNRLNTLFRQRELVNKPSNLKSRANQMLTALKLKKVHGLQKGVGVDVEQKFKNLIHQMINSFFDSPSNGNSLGPDIKAEIAKELGEQFLPEFLAAMTPYVGLITSGSNAVHQWGKTAIAYYRKNKVINRREVVRAGNPSKAVDAIKIIMIRESHSHLTKASICTVEFSAKGIVHLSGAGAVGDTVIGGLSSFAKLSHALFLVGRDYVEKRNVNNIMTALPIVNIDHSIFDVCPIIGCYYVVSSDTSDIINFMIEDMGKNGWMTEVEKLNKELEYIEKQARRLIDNYRFYIPNMPKLPMSEDLKKEKGIEKPGMTDRMKWTANRLRGKIPIR